MQVGHLSTLVDQILAAIDERLHANKIVSPDVKNVCVLGGGSNDIFQGASVETIISRWDVLAANIKANGWYLIASTIPPTCVPFGSIEAFGIKAEAVNAHIRASSYTDKICDLWADIVDGSTYTAKDGYLQSDGIHFLLPATSAFASRVKSVIDKLVV